MIVPWVDLRDPNLPRQSQWAWAAAGNSHETGGRLLLVGWIRQWLRTPGANVFASGNPLSLVREILYTRRE